MANGCSPPSRAFSSAVNYEKSYCPCYSRKGGGGGERLQMTSVLGLHAPLM